MVRLTARLLSPLIALATALPAPASAAQYLITYTGEVYDSQNPLNYFGLTGENSLEGLAYTLDFTLTVPTPGAIIESNATTDRISGGSSLNAPSPLSAVITINGVSMGLSGSYLAVAEQLNNYVSSSGGAAFDQIRDLAGGPNNETLSAVISSTVNNILDSADYKQSLVYDPGSTDTAYGYFQFTDYSLPNGSYGFNYVNGRLTVDRVTVTPPAPPPSDPSSVPEPAPWAMMIAGFGLIGAALRRYEAARPFRMEETA